MQFLLVEDEHDLSDILYDYLHDAFPDSTITQVFNGRDASDLIKTNQYDLYLLDVMLPHKDGFELCKEISNTFEAPIIMLSALSDEDNQLKGYQLGIDEYITKPYSPQLVIEKIKAILTRYRDTSKHRWKQYGIIKYNLDRQKIIIEDINISLNKKEWDLFETFITHKEQIFTRDDLLNRIWGYDYFGYERTVDTHIKRLRKKLNSASSYIKTVYKQGYKFEK